MINFSKKIAAPLAIATMLTFGAAGLVVAAEEKMPAKPVAKPAAKPAAKKVVKPAVKKAAKKVAKPASKKMMKAKASPRVKAVQAKLVAAGYKIKDDGVLGAKTRAALKEFQKKAGLKATGRINKATLAKLGLK